MTIDLSIVDEFEKRFGPSTASEKANRVMIDYISLIRAPLPKIAAEGLAAAKQFAHGLIGADEATSARVRCWKYLDEQKASTDLSTPQYCIVRAVICALYDPRESSESVGETLDFFFRMANKFEDHSGDAVPLLRKRFHVGNDSPSTRHFGVT